MPWACISGKWTKVDRRVEDDTPTKSTTPTILSLSSPGLHLFSSKSPTSRTHTGSSYIEAEKRASKTSGKSIQDANTTNDSQADTSRPPDQVEEKTAAAEKNGEQKPQEPGLDEEDPPTKNDSVEDCGDAPAEDNRTDETNLEAHDASVSQEEPVKDANGEEAIEAVDQDDAVPEDGDTAPEDNASAEEPSPIEAVDETDVPDADHDE
ncbi:hypothetical protein THAOC_16648, partial [Thalassiosira oceanica]